MSRLVHIFGRSILAIIKAEQCCTTQRFWRLTADPHLHGFSPPPSCAAGRNEGAEVDCVWHDTGVVLLHACKHLQRLVPVLALGAHVQQAGEGCRLRVEVGAANDVRYLSCRVSNAREYRETQDLSHFAA